MKKDKLPKLLYEYEIIAWDFTFFSNSKFYNNGDLVTTVCKDGILIKTDCNNSKETILHVDEKTVSELNELIKEKDEILKNIPSNISNPLVLAGYNETFRLGKYKFSGSNLFTESVKHLINSKDCWFDVKSLELLYELQCIFEEIKEIFSRNTPLY